ncbi:MAG: peptidase [Roseomonas sp.]|nr:peptidase [Roseomonas sp.]MCA3342565.1 peptidase [Roseomonas sp.]
MKQLHIFRTGIHQPMQGGALEFREADLAATAAAYDPALGEAPLVVGHPKTDAPAYGWVRALRAEGGDLVAEPHQVEPAFAEMVQAGRFKKISASFYTPNHPSNPKPGSYYLKHVGFLGAAAPAVKGLRDVAFAADEADVITLEFAADGAVSGWRLSWLLADVGGLFRGIRDWMVAKEGVEAAEKLLPAQTVQRMTDEAARMQGEADAARAAAVPPPAFAEDQKQETVTVPTEKPDDADRIAALDARERDLQVREAAIAQADAARRAAEMAAFTEKLVAEARIPQGVVPRILAFAASLPATGEVSFTEGDATVKEAPLDAFRAVLSALPARVEFREVAPAGQVEFAADDPLAIRDAAQGYQAERAAAGESVSMAIAVEHVMKKRSAA